MSTTVTYKGSTIATVSNATKTLTTEGKYCEANIILVDVTGGGTAYTGETTVTPTQSTQTLQTSGYVMEDNITINPIPSNYGLITWNGSVLTVS